MPCLVLRLPVDRGRGRRRRGRGGRRSGGVGGDARLGGRSGFGRSRLPLVLPYLPYRHPMSGLPPGDVARPGFREGQSPTYPTPPKGTPSLAPKLKTKWNLHLWGFAQVPRSRSASDPRSAAVLEPAAADRPGAGELRGPDDVDLRLGPGTPRRSTAAPGRRRGELAPALGSFEMAPDRRSLPMPRLEAPALAGRPSMRGP